MSLEHPDREQIERQIQETGRACHEELRGFRPGIFDTRAQAGKLMEWATADPEFRVALFRFIDVLPSLGESSSVIAHAQAYFRPVAQRVPGILQWGLDLDPSGMRARVAASMIRRQVAAFGKQFIAGATPREALKVLRRLHHRGYRTTVDLLGEACVSEAEAEAYLARYLELIDAIRGLDDANISVKLSALYSRGKPVATEASIRALRERLRTILLRARDGGVFVYVDMEDTAKREITLETVKGLLMEEDFREWQGAGFVLQAYLRRTSADLDELLGWLRERGHPVAVRLVKGAYWDTETILARLAGWPVPVWSEKPSSDRAFETLSRRLLEAAPLVRPAFASHNLRSLVHAMVVAEALGVEREGFEFQTLYGMAEPVKQTFLRRGVTVREYVPIGDMLTGMAYLVRRLLENTANEGFIRSGLLEDQAVENLLSPPSSGEPDSGTAHLEWDPQREFRNAPCLDFTIQKNRTHLHRALEPLLALRNGDYPRVFPVIDGEAVKDCEVYRASRSPEDPDLVLGRFGMARPDHVEAAVPCLQAGFAKWRDRDPGERFALLYRVADRMETERAELAALMVMESGKPWLEADADVAEAIDFCRYYALQASKLFQPESLCPLDGEEDTHFYEPRGLVAVIGPWNFPLAIPCGMFCAALVTGNAPILKPAEQSTLVASRMFQLFLEEGMPADAAAFLPGRGEELGAALVAHPAIDTIAFTGSRAVGMEIIARAAELRPGQRHVKRVVAEMGGKNAILVDDGADLDQAVKGILYSAFGYAGQKCSACSRLYVHANISGRLMERLRPAVRSLVAGRASDPSVDLGPVIDEDTFKRILGAIDSAGLTPVQGMVARDLPEGFTIPATLFEEVPWDHPLFHEELFGPVLAATRVATFEEGLERANADDYGLTGAVFSRHPGHLRLATRTFRVGNLYLNRGCTGSLVGRQPFGGFKHSGVGSKAGGPDYLRQFVIPRLVCENTLRQGFAPMAES